MYVIFTVNDVCEPSDVCDTLQITGIFAGVSGTYQKVGLLIHERPMYKHSTQYTYLSYCQSDQKMWKLRNSGTWCGSPEVTHSGQGFWCDPTAADGWTDSTLTITCV